MIGISIIGWVKMAKRKNSCNSVAKKCMSKSVTILLNQIGSMQVKISNWYASKKIPSPKLILAAWSRNCEKSFPSVHCWWLFYGRQHNMQYIAVVTCILLTQIQHSEVGWAVRPQTGPQLPCHEKIPKTGCPSQAVFQSGSIMKENKRNCCLYIYQQTKGPQLWKC